MPGRRWAGEHRRQWRRRPRVGAAEQTAVTEAAWCLSQRYLLLHSLSESKADRFRKRFLRTFGLRLIPWSPLDYLADREQVEQLSAHAPQVTLGASAVRLTDVEA